MRAPWLPFMLLLVACGAENPSAVLNPHVPWFEDAMTLGVGKGTSHLPFPEWVEYRGLRKDHVIQVLGPQELWFATQYRGLLVLGNARETVALLLGRDGMELIARNPQTDEVRVLGSWRASW